MAVLGADDNIYMWTICPHSTLNPQIGDLYRSTSKKVLRPTAHLRSSSYGNLYAVLEIPDQHGEVSASFWVLLLYVKFMNIKSSFSPDMRPHADELSDVPSVTSSVEPIPAPFNIPSLVLFFLRPIQLIL